MVLIEIPLTNNAEQSFSIVLEGETYDVTVKLNSRTSIWSMSLSQSGSFILSNVALVGGVDIFSQYNIPITNAYVININNPSLDPDRDLGTTSKLLILTDEEVSGE